VKIEITTKFETSHAGNNHTVIVARIVTDEGVEICQAEDRDSWPDSSERPATASSAPGDREDEAHAGQRHERG
jgi:hypothetical protein